MFFSGQVKKKVTAWLLTSYGSPLWGGPKCHHLFQYIYPWSANRLRTSSFSCRVCFVLWGIRHTEGTITINRKLFFDTLLEENCIVVPARLTFFVFKAGVHFTLRLFISCSGVSVCVEWMVKFGGGIDEDCNSYFIFPFLSVKIGLISFLVRNN